MTRSGGPQPHMLYLSLGSNLGNRRDNLLRALVLIGHRVGQVCRTSSFLETEPWGFTSGNIFLNAACAVHTRLTPTQCLERTQQIEREMGRTSKSVDGQYHDRVIDIDLLLYDDLTLSTPQLTLPHPLMLQREFVTRPLAQIMPPSQYALLESQSQASAGHQPEP
ncbi:MAG TPA: 2-amino-4-hydroxy-6-hydroxymethyldihydropteridine diphosphokinase [Prevotellaceae bacterium]|mgnify:FL=1|nr:2-amino-4-hydroxy-6-hydroxymethyldihydropteridine diphosphokinase [Prevotellaceae bacterium]